NGIIFIAIAWAINIGMIYLITAIFPKAQGTHFSSYVSSTHSPVNFAELLIPENIFYDLANNIIPAIVIFSLLIGISLIHLKEKQAMMSSLETLVGALTRITGWIARVTPLGTFLIIANQVGTIHFSTIKQLGTYIILYLLGLSIVIFWIFPRLVSMLTSINAFKWTKDMMPILILAYTTNVVIVCLPYIIQLVQRETEMFYTKDEKVQNQIQGTVSVVFNLPLGSLFITVFIFFASLFYQTTLTAGNQFELFFTTFLTSLGGVGLGSWINSLTFLLDAMNLPLEAINIYLITLPFTAGFQSMVSAMEIASLSLFITLACRQLIKFRLEKILRGCVLIAGPVFLLFLGIKLFNPLPKIQNQTKSIYELSLKPGPSSSAQKKTTEKPIAIEAEEKHEKSEVHGKSGDAFDHILSTRTLRVGFNTNVVPFCFYSNNHEIVGYDVAFALELAKDLGCRLELVPMEFGNLEKDLKEDRYDIAMSAVSINEKRLQQLNFSHPYLTGKVVLVVRKDCPNIFTSLDEIDAKPDIKIAALKGSSYETLAYKLFPSYKIVLIDDYDTFAQARCADALLWQEQEAIHWIVNHPKYKTVMPTPSIGTDILAYPVKVSSERLLVFLNQWLQLKESEGFTEKQYNLWVLGKTQPASAEERRWSFIHDVLHWDN
ncbi:MAG TPA: cation:dicarboxylase symporter family transporter, partial [Rhabdochlamydiaceae bacterium]|nr:cation:dicarboxylase symporter family transporter [Rhabdochlamydiaceae bacterium]